jgi:hypothetical protein
MIQVRTNTRQTASNIQSNQQTVSHNLQSLEVRQNLTEYALAKPDELKGDLPKISSALKTATREHIKASPAVVSRLQNKLAALKPDAPNYWQTAGELITYRSQISVPNYQQLMSPDLPNCVDKPPIPMQINMDAETEMGLVGEAIKPGGLQRSPAIYENCRFTLDSPIEKAMIPELAEGRSYDLMFRHCQIVYHGGPITLLTPNPKPTAITGYGPTRSDVFMIVGQTIIFVDCVLLFDIKAPPVPDGQKLTRQLLSQSGSTLKVTFPNGATHS